MNEIQINISHELLPDQIGLVAAQGYINNDGGQAVSDAVRTLMNQGSIRILIDLEGTTIINSIGVSILLEIMENLMKRGGRLAFANLTPTIRKTFEIMGLNQFATIHTDRDEALGALRADEFA